MTLFDTVAAVIVLACLWFVVREANDRFWSRRIDF